VSRRSGFLSFFPAISNDMRAERNVDESQAHNSYYMRVDRRLRRNFDETRRRR